MVISVYNQKPALRQSAASTSRSSRSARSQLPDSPGWSIGDAKALSAPIAARSRQMRAGLRAGAKVTITSRQGCRIATRIRYSADIRHFAETIYRTALASVITDRMKYLSLSDDPQ